MKAVFLVLVSLAFVAAKYEYTEEEIAQYKKFMAECIKETKVDADLIEKVDKKTFPESYKDTKCYYKCLFNKFEYLDDKDEFLVDKIKGDLKEAVREKQWLVLEKCLKITGADMCEKAFESHKCYIKHEDEL